MLRLNLNVINTRSIIIAGIFMGISQTAWAACAALNHACRFHGTGRVVLPDGLNIPNSGVAAQLTWPEPVDVDLHALLPENSGPHHTVGNGRIAIASDGMLRKNEPFALGTEVSDNPRHVFYGHYDVAFQKGTALAEVSKDTLGGADNPNPTCIDQSGNNCERITLTGNLPDGVYEFQGYNFNNGKAVPAEVNYDLKINTGTHIVATFLDSHVGLQSGTLHNTEDKTQLERVEITNQQFEPHAVGTVLRYLRTSDYLALQYHQPQHQADFNDVRFGEIYTVENIGITQNIKNGDKVFGLPDVDVTNRINKTQKIENDIFGYYEILVSKDGNILLGQSGHVTSGLLDADNNIIIAAGGTAIGNYSEAFNISKSNELDGIIVNDTNYYHLITNNQESNFSTTKLPLDEKKFFEAYYGIHDSIGQKFDYKATGETANNCVHIAQYVYEESGFSGNYSGLFHPEEIGTGTQASKQLKNYQSINTNSCQIPYSQ